MSEDLLTLLFGKERNEECHDGRTIPLELTRSDHVAPEGAKEEESILSWMFTGSSPRTRPSRTTSSSYTPPLSPPPPPSSDVSLTKQRCPDAPSRTAIGDPFLVCSNCSVEFSYFARRQQCEQCHLVVCSTCAPLLMTYVRVNSNGDADVKPTSHAEVELKSPCGGSVLGETDGRDLDTAITLVDNTAVPAVSVDGKPKQNEERNRRQGDGDVNELPKHQTENPANDEDWWNYSRRIVSSSLPQLSIKPGDHPNDGAASASDRNPNPPRAPAVSIPASLMSSLSVRDRRCFCSLCVLGSEMLSGNISDGQPSLPWQLDKDASETGGPTAGPEKAATSASHTTATALATTTTTTSIGNGSGSTSTTSLTTGGKWQPDEAATACAVCHVAFSSFLRRHHCRWCGRVVCSPCSENRFDLTAPVANDSATFVHEWWTFVRSWTYRNPTDRVCCVCFSALSRLQMSEEQIAHLRATRSKIATWELHQQQQQQRLLDLLEAAPPLAGEGQDDKKDGANAEEEEEEEKADRKSVG
eukprot:TRINITY_DN4403_c0_g2_i1.p1 TRINITY_DN4403_c0_g2~~TRINITY_DN4403_c0_g2_i1.p1  ORF type:complete len:528 (-),score=107.93 TRINITY_DN4403_c0_g2_i1:121-1704(-)